MSKIKANITLMRRKKFSVKSTHTLCTTKRYYYVAFIHYMTHVYWITCGNCSAT